MAKQVKEEKPKVRKPKALNKKQLARMGDAVCPRCNNQALERVKGGQVFCTSCGCHISPKIFDTLKRG